MAGFKHYKLELLKPDFDSHLTDLVLELQHLRKLQLSGTTPGPMFFQLKSVFHLLESLGSARIEGNRTTIEEMVEAKISPPKDRSQGILEIENMEQALKFIDDTVKQGAGISRAYILELHKITVNNLIEEGDKTPGYFRVGNVTINRSSHRPPDYTQVDSYMDELFDFLRTEHDSKYDLIKIALAHHRFAWIHPFHNGNGRVVRLFTYALLIERGFNVRQGRVLNPSAVFCMNRDRYYDMLSAADSGDKNGLTTWCEYVLEGILVELSKIDRLSDYKYLSKNILRPAVACAQERELITKLEAAILKVAIEKIIFKAADIEHLMPGKIPQERSRIVRRMKELRLIEPIKEKGRNYVLELSRGPLLRGIIKSLEEEGFISINVQRPAI